MISRTCRSSTLLFALLSCTGILLLSPRTAWAFSSLSPSPWSSTATTRLKQAANDDQQPDLFEYFDPLLSPHAYPNGISPDEKPLKAVPPPPPSAFKNPFGIDYMAQKQQPLPNEDDSLRWKSREGEEDDLFDYFDPLLSPHSYPNGIINTKTKALEEDDRYNPLKLNSEVMSGNTLPGSAPKTIGILLMDHGSRNPESNARLHHLAELYQMAMGGSSGSSSVQSSTSQIIVKAAHMEIANPSIPEGLQALLDHGVDEIVCHPYFLSPGRHVMQDIPTIVRQAIEDLSIKIPVITTDPVGSNTQLMIGAIHSLVREHSQVLRQERTGN